MYGARVYTVGKEVDVCICKVYHTCAMMDAISL